MVNNSKVVELKDVSIRFSGDSGDGMQLTGTLFSDASAIHGNDISTFPDFPSEIRAPQGTVGGVSGFQVHFGSDKVNTPGDLAQVLVAMNPAAIKANKTFVLPGGVIVYDSDSFTEKNLKKAQYTTDDPFTELNMLDYTKIPVPISSLTKESLKESGLDNKSILRCKNMFALGVVCWMFERPLDLVENIIKQRFAKYPQLVDANIKVLKDGYNYGHNTHTTTPKFIVHPAKIEKGIYRNISGNQATAWGLLAAANRANLPLFIGSYPITPATDILHELAARKDMGVRSFQAEDEIAGICTSIGAAFAGHFAVTTTSGPGLALKGEAIGLSIMAELPLVIVNVQRGGPSTGLPTKTEQSDLMQSLYGRNGESPAVVIAASSPSDCFDYAFMAGKITLERMVPVILLTDGFLGNGCEPWKVPTVASLPSITSRVATTPEGWKPFARDEKTLAREWAYPGMPGFQHRVGGLEKDESGSVSHVPQNHQKMSDIREEKVQRVADMIPAQEIYGDQDGGDVLVVGWGGTFGHLTTAVRELREESVNVSLAHFNYIMPLPANTEEVFGKFKKIIVCELNNGQFVSYLRDKFPQFTYKQLNKLEGLPFLSSDIKKGVIEFIEE